MPNPLPDGRANLKKGAARIKDLVPSAAELRAMGVDDFDELRDDALYLVRRRLRACIINPGRTGRVQDIYLFGLAKQILEIERAKLASRQPLATDATTTNGHEVDIRALAAGLPPDRAKALLEQHGLGDEEDDDGDS